MPIAAAPSNTRPRSTISSWNRSTLSMQTRSVDYTMHALKQALQSIFYHGARQGVVACILRKHYTVHHMITQWAI
jgi:hypothetical protein